MLTFIGWIIPIFFTKNYDIFTVNQCVSPERIAHSVRGPFHVVSIKTSWHRNRNRVASCVKTL